MKIYLKIAKNTPNLLLIKVVSFSKIPYKVNQYYSKNKILYIFFTCINHLIICYLNNITVNLFAVGSSAKIL